MNPFTEERKPSTFLGKHFLGWINPKREKPKDWRYRRMKEKQIAKRRMRNKMARKSRRKNRLRRQGRNC